jgi:hypothetical protein
MSVITDRFCRARQLSRTLFPEWSRAMRARWVVAKLRSGEPRVPVSASWSHDPNAFAFVRRAS